MPMPAESSVRRDAVQVPGSARSAGGVRVVDAVVRDVPPALLPAWRALAREAAEANAFAELWFVAAGLRNLAGDGRIHLLEVWEGDLLLGLLPLHVALNYGRARVRIVKNWQHFHDFLGTPLVRAGREEAFWTAVLRHLDAADWAPGFVHFTGLVEGGPVHAGLRAAARALGRACPTVHRAVRAELASDLSPQAYYESRVRKKKRKELGRLRHRLDELGEVRTRAFTPGEAVEPWCDAFLALERSGWKGEAGTALACVPDTERFFREALAGAAAAGRLECLRMEVDGRPIAMLVNFITPPGAFSFKIAFDEDYARFSPGVLIQLENLAILDRGDIAWMDSCAVENHPMIDSLWSERRPVVRVSVRLKGARRGATYFTCRALETASAELRGAARAARRLSARRSMA